MRTVVALRLLPLLAVAVAAIGLAINASATTTKAAPYCKTGQKSTTAHPCVKPPKCKTGQKSTTAHPCSKPTTTTSTTSTTPKSAVGATTSGSGTSSPSSGSSGSSGTTASSGTASTQANGCPVGQDIPQGTFAGDGDEDNSAGPDDGDGCY
jgi:hypothetical protein